MTQSASLLSACLAGCAYLRPGVCSYNCLSPAGLKVLRELPRLERLELRAMRPELPGQLLQVSTGDAADSYAGLSLCCRASCV